MKSSPVKFIVGFVCLFLLYHAAEYMIMFKNSPAGFLIFQAIFFIAAWGLAQWQFKEGLQAWGLSIKKRFIPQLLLGMMMGVILYGLTYFVNLIAGIETKLAVPPAGDLMSLLLVFMFGNFFSSFSEDILTRGYLYKHFNGKIGTAALVFISAAVYLLNHIYRLTSGPDTYLYIFMLGVLFIIPVILTKRLWFTGGMHWAGNSFFYLTHGIIRSGSGEVEFSANYTLAIFCLLLIPVNYYLLKSNNMLAADRSGNVKKSIA